MKPFNVSQMKRFPIFPFGHVSLNFRLLSRCNKMVFVTIFKDSKGHGWVITFASTPTKNRTFPV